METRMVPHSAGSQVSAHEVPLSSPNCALHHLARIPSHQIRVVVADRSFLDPGTPIDFERLPPDGLKTEKLDPQPGLLGASAMKTRVPGRAVLGILALSATAPVACAGAHPTSTLCRRDDQCGGGDACVAGTCLPHAAPPATWNVELVPKTDSAAGVHGDSRRVWPPGGLRSRGDVEDRADGHAVLRRLGRAAESGPRRVQDARHDRGAAGHPVRDRSAPRP